MQRATNRMNHRNFICVYEWWRAQVLMCATGVGGGKELIENPSHLTDTKEI